MSSTQPILNKLQRAAVRIYNQVPGLACMGLAFWMTWNTIAFSGQFWLQEPDSTFIVNGFKAINLVACTATLCLLAAFAKRSTRLVTNNFFLIGGAILAAFGTAIVVGSYYVGDNAPGWTLFSVGSALSGVGTTAIFMRSAALFGAMPPSRAAAMLAICTMLSCGIFFMLSCIPPWAATAGFVLLPLMAVPFLLLRGGVGLNSERSLDTNAKTTRMFVVFLASVLLCSTVLEMIRSYALVGVPAEISFMGTRYANFLEVLVMLALIVVVLMTTLESRHFTYLYSGACAFIAIMLVAITLLDIETAIATASVVAGVSVYNMIVWAMLAYVVYQSQSSSVFVFGVGNAALAFGTVLGTLSVMGYQAGLYGKAVMQPLVLVAGIAVLACALLVFTEKRMDSLILPLEEGRSETSAFGDEAKRLPKQWIVDCERIADEYGLSARQKEVFIELARGKTAQEIADSQTVSIYTVRAHTRAIYEKLEVHSKAELRSLIEDQRS